MSMHPLPPKKEVALALLERSSVHVHLDPRASGVVVPAWFKKQPQLVLQVGLNMPVPIPDLRVDDDGLSCTLSFNRSPFYCVVPWSTVYAMVGDDGRGMVWPDDVPPEVAAQARDPGKKVPAGKRPTLEAAPVLERGPERAEKTTDARRDGAPGTKKKPRKRPRIVPDAEGQRALVAVPPAEPAKRPAVPVPVPAPAAAQPLVGKPVDPRQRAARPKRELPPYLRVVK
jgi:stringent starvation protein B